MRGFSIKSPIKLTAQVALAGVMAFGLTAAVNTFAASGKTGLTVITHLDTPKPGKLNQRLPGVQFTPTCEIGNQPVPTGVGRTDADGASTVDFSHEVEKGQKVTCDVKVPKSFTRDGTTYTLLKSENNPKRTLFKSDITSVVRFSYQAAN